MVRVQITKSFQDIDVSVRKLQELVKTICRRFDLSKAVISIAIVDGAQMRKLNRQFLGRNASTDCLSFDLSEGDECRRSSSASFELIVNGELAIKEALLRGHSSEAELALYVTHSMLHNLGFDDSTQEQAHKMHDAEDEILRQFGYGVVYDKKVRSQKCKSTKA
jgi:probable rRNA maturation factor